MAIDLLDMNKTWAKIKAGFRGSVLFNSPARAANPTGYKNGRNPLTEQAQMTSGQVKGSAFTGKVFANRK